MYNGTNNKSQTETNPIDMRRFLTFPLRLCALVLPLFIFSSACHSSNASKDSESVSPPDEEGYVNLLDGNSLAGWEGDTSYWRMENGILIGEITPSAPPLKNNTFLIWKEEKPADFELKVEFKISAQGNSGINYRSEEVEGVPYALKGYQADIDGANNYTGQNYEERGRTTLGYRGQQVTIPTSEEGASKGNAWTAAIVDGSLGSSDSLKTLIHSGDWNECHLIVKGNRLQHYINGVLMSDVTDNDTVNRKSAGLLGVQLHVGHPMKVEYRNLRIKQE